MVPYGEKPDMTEEQVTKHILRHLIDCGWEIICYDFPHSGMGYQLHPDNASSKTEGTIIPDIVAVKDTTAVIFENKDHFERADFIKLNSLRSTTAYTQAWKRLFGGKKITQMKFCIGLPDTPQNQTKARQLQALVDHIFFVNNNTP